MQIALRNSKILTTVFAIASLLAVGALIAQPVSAVVLSLQQLQIDGSIAQEDNAYITQGQIVVVPIFAPTADYPVRDQDWFKGLYYFMIGNAQRPGFTDIPFHYVISREGSTFKGNSGGEERKITIKDLGDDYVVIGYLAGKGDNGFDPRAAEPLAELLLDVANRNSINPDKISVSAARYVRDDANKTISLQRQDIFGLWDNSLKSVVDKIRSRYSPIARSYSAAVVSVDLPTEAVNPGDEIAGKITLQNTGSFGHYNGTASQLLGTKTASNSNYYLDGAWASRSQFELISTDGDLLPNGEVTYDFRLKVPLVFGEYSEGFVLKTVAGVDVGGASFELKLNINRPAGTIVEVKNNTAGWIFSYTQPSTSANEARRLSAGERYLQKSDLGNGWIELDLGDVQSGWVAIWDISYI